MNPLRGFPPARRAAGAATNQAEPDDCAHEALDEEGTAPEEQLLDAAAPLAAPAGDAELVEDDGVLPARDAAPFPGDATALDDAQLDPLSEGWFYEDDANEVLHGPYALTKLKEWLVDGHCELSDLARHGRDGEDVALSTLVRVAENGGYCTRAEFAEYYGGTDEWVAANPM